MATYYAWSEIQSGKGKERFTAKVGDKVTASDLGLNDDQFQELIDSGSVRDRKFPDLGGAIDLSPREHRIRQLYANVDPEQEAEEIAAAEAAEAETEGNRGSNK